MCKFLYNYGLKREAQQNSPAISPCKWSCCTMSFFATEEPKTISNHWKLLHSSLMGVLTQCNAFRSRRKSFSSADDELPSSDVDDDYQMMVVSAIRSRGMQHRRKDSLMNEGVCWVFSMETGELFIAPKGLLDEGGDREVEDEDKEDFHSVKSYFTHCLIASRVDFGDVEWWPLNQEFCQCKGWPFGLYRNAMMLPPLPRSPSESWTWSRRSPMV